MYVYMYIDLEMAIAYWNIVLKDRFRFLDIWCQFLQVSVEFWWVWCEGGREGGGVKKSVT